jgi:transposase
MRYQLTDHEWVAIKPMLPNKPRGVGNFLSPSLMRAGTGRPARWAYPGQGPFGRAPGRDRSDRHNPSSTRNFDFLGVHRHKHRSRSDSRRFREMIKRGLLFGDHTLANHLKHSRSKYKCLFDASFLFFYEGRSLFGLVSAGFARCG